MCTILSETKFAPKAFCFVFSGFSYRADGPDAEEGLFPRKVLKCWYYVIDLQERRLISVPPLLSLLLRGEVFLP